MSLKLNDSRLATSKNLLTISKLTNLEVLELNQARELNDATSKSYSTLTKLRHLIISYCANIRGLGLSYLVANKPFLVNLEISNCMDIRTDGYHCLSTLHNLTSLTIHWGSLDDYVMGLICSNCCLIQHLDLLDGVFVTGEGISNISCLVHLKSLYLQNAGNDCLEKLTQNKALTHLILEDCFGVKKGVALLSSIHSNLKIERRFQDSGFGDDEDDDDEDNLGYYDEEEMDGEEDEEDFEE
jgi:hypothetical protein